MRSVNLISFFCISITLFGLLISSFSYSSQEPLAQKELNQLQDKVVTIIEEKCLSCHSYNTELPFYAKIPGIKQIIEKDFKDGLRASDLHQDFIEASKKGIVDESTVAKLEWVIENRTMPPAKFTAVHWGSRVSKDDEKIILEWVKRYRKAYYATGLASLTRANEPIQPIPDSIPYDKQKAALGEKLFNDRRLSHDNTIRCASCHVLSEGMADGKQFATGINKQTGHVNAPTIYNAVFNIRQFWDGRTANLQEQASQPPLNPIEMGSTSWDEILEKLAKDKKLTEEFLAVYPDGWTEQNVTDAIAEYEKLFITPNSPFDRWLKGDDTALTTAELRGYKLFKAYRCATCHVGKSMGGQSFEYMDLKKDYFADRGYVEGVVDDGRIAFTHDPRDLHRFKVPNLRNIEMTAPYLHDGTVTSLDEAVRIMGIYLVGMDIPKSDRDSIVLFLRTLTGQFNGQKVFGTPVPQ